MLFRSATANTPGFANYGTRGALAVDGVYGALTCDGRKISAITDGSSNTILVIEDAGRSHPTVGIFGANASAGLRVVCSAFSTTPPSCSPAG